MRITTTRGRERRVTPPLSPSVWRRPWLAWLDEVENLSGIRYLGDYPVGENRLEHLHEMFETGRTSREGADWLEAELDG